VWCWWGSRGAGLESNLLSISRVVWIVAVVGIDVGVVGAIVPVAVEEGPTWPIVAHVRDRASPGELETEGFDFESLDFKFPNN